MQQADRLTRGLEQLGLNVSAEGQSSLLWYLDELQRWNRRINLTAIRDLSEGVEKHLLDSLTPLPLLREEEKLVDLGSGPGLPGIALKIARPSLKIVSVESVGKKASFQRHVARSLHLSSFEVCAERAQSLAKRESMSGAFTIVISRAFSSLGLFAQLALPFLEPAGRLVAMKGAEGERELQREVLALHDLGFEVKEVRRLRLPFSNAERTLIVLGRIAARARD
jgi:16S rRNA (guanine527-N7)-methyltransferase